MATTGPGEVWCVFANVGHGEQLAGSFLEEGDAWNFADTVPATRITHHVMPYSVQVWAAQVSGVAGEKR